MIRRSVAAGLLVGALLGDPAAASSSPGSDPDLLPRVAMLLALVAAFTLVRRRLFYDARGWSTRVAGPVDPSALPPRRRLDEIRDHDPDFSVVLLEDFLVNLYTQAHAARGAPAIRPAIRPYLRPSARAVLTDLGEHPVTDVLVGGTQIRDITRVGQRWQITVGFAAHSLETPPGGSPRGIYSRERWVLSRPIDLRSRPPERARALGCPNCGAPARSIHGATCDHCDQLVDSGDFDWIVEHIVVERREPRPPDLTGDVPDVATQGHTVYDPFARVAWKQLLRKDPTFSAPQLSARVGHIFATTRRAWSTQRWADARPLLSDALHHARSYWLAAYRDAGLRNITQDARITNLEIVRCTSDRWYDAITVRVHATGLDYTIDHLDSVVGGSTTRERPYSEYWTLIRGRAVERDDAACPQCAAPLILTTTGDCDRCGAYLTTAAFDWVLSRTERDEAYRG